MIRMPHSLSIVEYRTIEVQSNKIFRTYANSIAFCHTL